jgi:uncharacterized membrane protein
VTVIDELRAPAAAVASTRGAPRPVMAMIAASAVAFFGVWSTADVADGAMAAVMVAAIVWFGASHARWRSVFDQRPARALLTGAVIGLVACVGSLATAQLSPHGSSTATTVCQLVVMWTAVAMIRTPARARSAQVVLAPVLVVGAASLAAGVGLRSAAALMMAAPAALLLYFVVNSARRPRPDDVSRTAWASVAAVVAALAALASTGATDRPMLAVMMLVSLCAAGVISTQPATLGRPMAEGCRIAGGWLIAAGWLVAVACIGAGPGALALIALVGAGVALAPETDTPQPDEMVARDPSVRTARRAVLALTLVGLALRVATRRGLWLDEATSVHQARLPLVEMIRQIYLQDNHPPLHHIVLWFDMRLVGDSELAVRLPSIAFGALLIPMLYMAGRELFDRRTGLIAAAIGTVAPIAVWYGQEARMYSQFMLLALITVYALARIVRAGDRRYWVVFTLGSVALVYTQYFAVLHVAATVVVLLVEVLRRRRTQSKQLLKPLVVSLAVQAVLILPLVPYALHQAAHNQQSGFGFSAAGIAQGSEVVPRPGIYGLITNIQWALFGYQPDALTTRLVALWPVGLLLILLLLGKQRRPANRPLVMIAAIPTVVVFAASFAASSSRSLAEVRYFAGAVPVVLLLLAAGLTTVVRSVTMLRLAVGGLILTMLAALGVQEFSTENPRLYQYREAIEAVRVRAQAGDELYYSPQFLDYVLEYYGPGIASAPVIDGLPAPDEALPRRIFLAEATSFAEGAQDRTGIEEAIDELEGRGMTVRGEYRYAQITVWELG